MNVAWGRATASPGDSVDVSGEADGNSTNVHLYIYNATEMGPAGPSTGATPVWDTADLGGSAMALGFGTVWQIPSDTSTDLAFVAYAVEDGYPLSTPATAVSSPLALAAAAPASDPQGPADPADPAPGSAVTYPSNPTAPSSSVDPPAPAAESDPPADPGASPAQEPDPAPAAPGADPTNPADPAAPAAATPSNLVWQQADGTAITSARTSGSVTASFDVTHSDANQVSVVVLASDQTTQVATPMAMERSDQSGWSAPWIVAATGDPFYFSVTVSNGDQVGSAVVSGPLAITPPAPILAYYYPPTEKPSLDYVVTSEPPPADSGQVIYHQGSQTGPVLDTVDLVTAGTGHLDVDLTDRSAATDSPLFLEFVFRKQGHDDQTAIRAISLADPAPDTIDAPAMAKPGDTIDLSVHGWNAIVYDTAAMGRPSSETDPTRISDADKAAVKWRIGGTVVADQGEHITYTIPADAAGSLEVVAFLDRSSGFAAQTTVPIGCTGCHLTLAWKDPGGTEHPFPVGFPFKADFGAHHVVDVAVTSGGAIDFTPPAGSTSVTLKHDHAAESRFIASATDGTTGDDAEKWVVDADLVALSLDSYAAWRVAPTWSLAQTTATVEGTSAWDGTKFTLDATQAIATPSAPAKVTIDLHWQFFAYRFWDRKNKALALVPRLFVEGYLDGRHATGAPETGSNWVTSSGNQAMPWLIQANARGTAQVKPDANVLLRFRTAPTTYVDTTADAALGTTNPPSPQTDAGLNAGAATTIDPTVPAVERLALYDLPTVWKSRQYYARVGTALPAPKADLFENLATTATTDDQPLVFCLDDIVLVKPDASHHLVPLTHAQWDPAQAPAAIFANNFLRTATSTDDDIGPFRSDHANYRSYFSAGVSNLNDAHPRNYIADHPEWGWTRLVIAKGNCYDVFDRRTADVAGQVVGARAAVRWVDAVSVLAQGSSQEPRTTQPSSPTPFFSIIPFHTQNQWLWVGAMNATQGLGRFDQVMLRCCDVDPTDATLELGATMNLCRFHVEMAPSWTGSFATSAARGLGAANHAWANGTQPHAWWSNTAITGLSNTGTYQNALPANMEFYDPDEKQDALNQSAQLVAAGGTVSAKFTSLANHQPFKGSGVTPRWSGPEMGAAAVVLNPGPTFIRPQDPAKKWRLRSIWFAMHLPRSQCAMELGVFSDHTTVDDGHGHHHHRYSWVRAYCSSYDGTLPYDRLDVVPDQDNNGGYGEGGCVIVHETGHMCGNIDEYAEGGVAGMTGFMCYSPGSPFIFDDRSMMKGNLEPRARQRWAEAEACFTVYGTDMEVYHDQGANPARVFKLPHFNPALITGYALPHATPLRYNFVNWPLAQINNAPAGTHGQANLVFQPLGDDPYGADVLPTLVGTPGAFDGIIKVNVNVAVQLDHGVAAADHDSVIQGINTGLATTTLFFAASGAYQALNFTRVLVAVDLRYAETTASSHVTIASVATAPAAAAGSPYTNGSTWDAHHPRKFVWSRNAAAGPPPVVSNNPGDLAIAFREILGLPAVQVSAADDATQITPLIQQVFPNATVAPP